VVRGLTKEEIAVLDWSSDMEQSAIAVETTIAELAEVDAGTDCGMVGNSCFRYLAEKGYKHRKCRGWFIPGPSVYGDKPVVTGMFHIKIQTEETAKKVERLAAKGGGSLRFDGESEWDGYMVFEIE
jgi:hypothetical protein